MNLMPSVKCDFFLDCVCVWCPGAHYKAALKLLTEVAEEVDPVCKSLDLRKRSVGGGVRGGGQGLGGGGGWCAASDHLSDGGCKAGDRSPGGTAAVKALFCL